MLENLNEHLEVSKCPQFVYFSHTFFCVAEIYWCHFSLFYNHKDLLFQQDNTLNEVDLYNHQVYVETDKKILITLST